MGLIRASPACCQDALCPCPPWRWHSPFLAGGDPLGPGRCARCGPASAGFPVGGSRVTRRWSGPLQGVLSPLEGVALLPLQRRKMEPRRTLPKVQPPVRGRVGTCAQVYWVPRKRSARNQASPLGMRSDDAIFLHSTKLVSALLCCLIPVCLWATGPTLSSCPHKAWRTQTLVTQR